MKNGKVIKFDIKVTTRKGALYYAYFKWEVAAVSTDESHNTNAIDVKKKKISIDLAHQIMGHPD